MTQSARAVSIDPQLLEETVPTHNGAVIPLTEEQRQKPLFFKYISTNALVADFRPEPPWIEEVTADIPIGANRRPRIMIGDSHGVRPDDGLVITVEGNPEGIYARMDDRAPWQPEEDLEEWEEDSESEAERAVRWTFRLAKLLLTDGPLQRDLSFRNEEQKAELAKEGMYEAIGNAIAEAFQKGASNFSATPGDDNTPAASELLKSVDLEALMAEVQTRTATAVGVDLDTGTVVHDTRESEDAGEVEEEEPAKEEDIDAGEGSGEVATIKRYANK